MGIPQGKSFNDKDSPLMFLLNINDISKNIHSQLRLFADDCLLYRVINTEQDTLQLQQELDILSNWAETWQLKFNINKCTIMQFTRSTSPLTFNYQLNKSYPLQISIFILVYYWTRNYHGHHIYLALQVKPHKF